MTTTLHTQRAQAGGLTAPSIRPFLLFDAALTGANGLAYAALVAVLDDLFGVSRGLLIGIGVFLAIVALEVAWLATRRPIPRAGVRTLGVVNLAWTAASVVFAIVADLTTVGVVWTLLQAAIVLGFAVRQLQIAGR